jgi:hypothetical protein
VFRTNGSNTDILIINSSGNVGIGTTTPSTKLHVVASSTISNSNLANAHILVGTTSAGLGFDPNEIYFKGHDGVIGVIDAYNLYFNTNASTKMFIKSDGNVGIGTTAPTSKLHVVGTGNITGDTTIGGNLSVTGDTTIGGNLSVSGQGASVSHPEFGGVTMALDATDENIGCNAIYWNPDGRTSGTDKYSWRALQGGFGSSVESRLGFQGSKNGTAASNSRYITYNDSGVAFTGQHPCKPNRSLSVYQSKVGYIVSSIGTISNYPENWTEDTTTVV